jgi:hypothetical protein
MPQNKDLLRMWGYKWSCAEDRHIFLENIARQIQGFQYVNVCEERAPFKQSPLR